MPWLCQDALHSMGLMQAIRVGRRRIWILVGTLAVAGLLVMGGIAWAVWWVADNLDAPGPGATGSGPCTSADAVNVSMMFGDGHVVQACTRDRPACPNQAISGGANNQSVSVSVFDLRNQLRSTTRRYILSIRFDAALPAESAQQTLSINPLAGFPPGAPGSGPPNTDAPLAAAVQVTPRDPNQDTYVATSGSVVISSSHGVARGQVDGQFTGTGPIRPDRSGPPSNPASPVSLTGVFACDR